MERRYKPLLPALKSPGDSPDPGESSPATKRKRMYVKTACDICRVKKTACDRQRPACTPCVKRKSPCTFSGRPAVSEDTRSPNAASNVSNEADSTSIVTALLTAHDAEAHELLDRMRQGRGTLEVLWPWSEEDEEASKAPTLLPPDQTSMEFELMIRHPVAYPALVPLDSHSQNASATDRLQTSDAGMSETEQGTAYDQDLSDATALGPSGHADYAEKLQQVHFARWTDVSISGSEAASAVANYLAHDHVLLHLFDTDLFLRDLIRGDGPFCSSLLVNALLGWSLRSIGTSSGEYLAQADAAYSRALQQLQIQSEEPASLSELAAVVLLSLTALFKGNGKKSHALLQKGLLTGHKLGLLTDLNESPFNADARVPSSVDQAAEAKTSWGLFCFNTMVSLHCQTSALSTSLAPAYAFPESRVEEQKRASAAIPSCVSKLWDLMHEVTSSYYGHVEELSSQATVAFASSILNRLLQWAEELPVALTRGNRSTQEVMIMHTYLHAAIMAVTHPLAIRRDPSPLLEGANPDRSAEAIYSASAAQMHRLVDIYRFHSRITTSSIFWHTALIFSANASVRSAGGQVPIRQRHFHRAMDGFADLHRRYPVMQAIYRGLMTMAVDVGLVGSQEAVRLARKLADRGTTHGGAAQATDESTEVCFIVDLEMALVDRGLAHVSNLLQRFDEIVMFDDFTHEHSGQGVGLEPRGAGSGS